MDVDKIVYSINVKDVQNVATEQYGRKLTEKEVNFVEERLGDYVDWYESVCSALTDLSRNNKETIL